MNKIWTDDKINFLTEYYPTHGITYCEQYINLTKKQIRYKVAELGIKLNKDTLIKIHKERHHHTKPNHLLKVNPEQFITPSTKEVAYILGFLWGDGYLNKNRYGIWCQILHTDFEYIYPILEQTGKWTTALRKRNNKQDQSVFCTHSKVLYEFLLSVGYGPKNSLSAKPILSIIPNDIKPYWFRGFFDADGCFYYNPKTYQSQMHFSSNYEQNWDFVEQLFSSLDIYYKISREISVLGHRHSCIRCSSKNDILKFGNYIYNPFDFGFTRKYNKFLEIIASCH